MGWHVMTQWEREMEIHGYNKINIWHLAGLAL